MYTAKTETVINKGYILHFVCSRNKQLIVSRDVSQCYIVVDNKAALKSFVMTSR